MNTINYWRNSLADAVRLNPNFDKLKTNAIPVDVDCFRQGRIPNEATVKLFGPKINNSQITIIEVLLCPIIAYIKKEHSTRKGNHPDTLTPLWIPALLNKEGQLLVASKKVPWIPRDYLDPCLSGVHPIGTLAEVDRFLSKKPFECENWEEYWSHTIRMFTEITDTDLDLFEHEQYMRSTDSVILPNEQMDGAASAMLSLYDHIRATKPTLKLLDHVASMEDQPFQIAMPLEQTFHLANRHLGQMGQQYALSESQRESIHHWSQIEEGELLALNGPPGTGKTTFLQSVISTAWIGAAMRQDEPPIMVVTSANNQPVTNVIESFAKIQEIAHPLAGRWIPQVEGYGSYLASSSKKEKDLKVHWQTIKMDRSSKKYGLLANLENLDELSKAAHAYLEHTSRYSGQSFERIEDAVDYLHQQLVECIRRMEQTIESYDCLRQFENHIRGKYPEGIGAFKEQAESELHRKQTERSQMEKLHSEWVEHLNGENRFIKWLSFIPFVKRLKIKKDRSFLESIGITQLVEEEEVNNYFQNQKSQLQAAINETEESCRAAEREDDQLSRYRDDWNVISNQLVAEILTYFPNDQHKIDTDPFALLDRTRRYEAFKLAVHYWEGRWILETRDMLNDPNYKQTKGVKSQQKLWRRYAKLTPCFVTTLYMLPAFFKAWQGSDQYLYEFIDTFIIDEAGQVTPELAGASFALAKKALIVGDILQIEPIWNIPYSIDGGNLLEYKLAKSKDEAFELQGKGITASSGSVMLAARRKTKITSSPSDGGMWLIEHRRCVPEIINYCNELAYGGRLQAKRPSLPSYPLPHMGYAHIPGEAKKRNGSYLNEIEADAIVSWIHRNQELLIQPYVKEGAVPPQIDEVVAIITPFYQQKKLILEKLARTGLNSMKQITVGTVHALQGAERPIVLFSPVYDANSGASLFFDSGKNMLNVAVSRAQDSFLVFGDMRIFDPLANTPSGILAKYLFATEEQEIQNAEMPLYYKTRLASPIDHIHDLEGHRTMLAHCIRTANKEVHIVSPFLSANALEADDLQDICEEVTKRGIKVVVYTDEALNLRNGFLPTHFLKAKDMLSAWGVQVIKTKRVHSKALWVDKDMLIEGSFNWLSAVRQPNSRWCRYETSLIFRGDKVGEMIEKIKEDLEKRIECPIY